MKGAALTFIICVLSLMGLGMAMLYSSSMSSSGAGLLLSQLKWAVVGFVAATVAAKLDYRILKKRGAPIVIYLGVLMLLGLVLVPGIGEMKNGARRWFVFGGQPSELAKIALIIMIAYYCEIQQRNMRGFFRGLVFPGMLIGCVFALIFLEPDWGTALLVTAVGGVILLVAGVRWLHVIPIALVGAILLGYALWQNPVRRTRVMAFLYPEEYKETKGYQVYQAKLALGSGGLTGKGLGAGRQKLGFVPEHHTDFILSVIGEELGLIATLAVILGFVVIVFCGTMISARAPDAFGQYLAIGITFTIGLQAFINIGVVSGSLPNKGIPLPFISYGGSDLMTLMVLAGMLVSVARVGAATGPASEQRDPEDENIFGTETEFA